MISTFGLVVHYKNGQSMMTWSLPKMPDQVSIKIGRKYRRWQNIERFVVTINGLHTWNTAAATIKQLERYLVVYFHHAGVQEHEGSDG